MDIYQLFDIEAEIEKRVKHTIESLVVNAIDELVEIEPIESPLEDVNHAHIGFPRRLLVGYHDNPRKVLETLDLFDREKTFCVALFHLYECEPLKRLTRNWNILVKFSRYQVEKPVILSSSCKPSYTSPEMKAYCKSAISFPLVCRIIEGDEHYLNEQGYSMKWEYRG